MKPDIVLESNIARTTYPEYGPELIEIKNSEPVRDVFLLPANKPVLTLTYEDGTVSINMKTMRLLGFPHHIRMLFYEKSHTLLVGGADTERNDSLAVHAPSSDYIFHNRFFMATLTTRMGWGEHEAYRAVGVFVPRIRMVAFSLDEAERIIDGKEQLHG